MRHFIIRRRQSNYILDNSRLQAREKKVKNKCIVIIVFLVQF